MSDDDYLQDLLKLQQLQEGCDELLALDAERDNVENLLKLAYPNSNIIFTHGGSRAKGTMIREDYDLDEVCYFENDDTAPGQTLEEIYRNIAELLGTEYQVECKRSALRLKNKKGRSLKIDIVPGRYVSYTSTDVFLHQNAGNKERLKTNLEVHIAHVRDSGCTNEIQLGKLWRSRNGIPIRTFPLELLIIEILSTNNTGNLQSRFERVLIAFRDEIYTLKIEDPANPTGNDLSFALTDELRHMLRDVAEDTLAAAADYGWEHVFGALPNTKFASMPRVTALTAAAATLSGTVPPWSAE